jgi:hypothetical protein
VWADRILSKRTSGYSWACTRAKPEAIEVQSSLDLVARLVGNATGGMASPPPYAFSSLPIDYGAFDGLLAAAKAARPKQRAAEAGRYRSLSSLSWSSSCSSCEPFEGLWQPRQKASGMEAGDPTAHPAKPDRVRDRETCGLAAQLVRAVDNHAKFLVGSTDRTHVLTQALGIALQRARGLPDGLNRPPRRSTAAGPVRATA